MDRENLSTICGMVGLIRTLTLSKSADVRVLLKKLRIQDYGR